MQLAGRPSRGQGLVAGAARDHAWAEDASRSLVLRRGRQARSDLASTRPSGCRLEVPRDVWQCGAPACALGGARRAVSCVRRAAASACPERTPCRAVRVGSPEWSQRARAARIAGRRRRIRAPPAAAAAHWKSPALERPPMSASQEARRANELMPVMCAAGRRRPSVFTATTRFGHPGRAANVGHRRCPAHAAPATSPWRRRALATGARPCKSGSGGGCRLAPRTRPAARRGPTVIPRRRTPRGTFARARRRGRRGTRHCRACGVSGPTLRAALAPPPHTRASPAASRARAHTP